LKWNINDVVKSNQLFKGDDDVKGEDEGGEGGGKGESSMNNDELYDKMVEDFVKECEESETYVISYRFYTRKKL